MPTTAIRLLSCVALPWLAGCSLLLPPPPGPPVARFDAEHGVPARTAIDPAQVMVLTPDALPDGFLFEGKMELHVEPDFPAPADPHQVLGEVRVDVNRHHQRAAYLDVMRREAARHGANALVMLDESGDRCYARTSKKCRLGIAVHVSAAPPATRPSARDALSTWQREHGKLGQRLGAPVTVDLGQPRGAKVSARRGECITFVLALDDDVRLARVRGRAILALAARSSTERRPITSSTPAELGGRARTVELRLECAQGAAELYVYPEARTTLTGQRSGTGVPLGTGTAVLQAFVRRVGDRELARLAEARSDAERAYQAEQQASLAQACRECIGHWRRCVMADPDIQSGQCSPFNSCVERKYENPRACVTP